MKKLSDAELLEKIVYSGLRNAFPRDELDEVARNAVLVEHDPSYDQHFIAAKVKTSHKGENFEYGCVELVYDEGKDDWFVFFDGEGPDGCFDFDAGAGVHKIQFF